MIKKQLWRQNSKVLLSFIFLLSCCAHILSMEENEFFHESNTLPLDIQDRLIVRPPLISLEKQEDYIFHGHTWKQMMQSYESAPWRVKNLVNRLNHPEKFKGDNYRAAFFIGAPGVGKTTAALAVPHVANWFCQYVPSSEFQGTIRNQASQHLLSLLKAVVKINKKTVVIVDELEELLEHHQSDKYDTASNGCALWTFLDRQAGNQNFFFIGIMNRDTEIQEQLKSRMDGRRFVFDPIEPVKKKAILRDILEEGGMALAKDCDDAFFNTCIKKLGDAPIRSYRNLYTVINDLLAHNQSSIITKKIIDEAVATIIKDRQEMQVGKKVESDAERQERLHRENMVLQKTQFAQQLAVQTATAYYSSEKFHVGSLRDIRDNLFTAEQRSEIDYIQWKNKAGKPKEDGWTCSIQ